MIILYILGGILALVLLYALFLTVCALLVDGKKEYEDNSDFYRALVTSVDVALVKGARVRLHIEGLEKLPKDTKKILFVGNHRSNFDPIVSWYALRKWKIAYISKASNFKIPVIGRLVRRCCFMTIDREDPRKAILTIQKAAAVLEKEQVSVGVYPEGTRSKEGVLLPFHNGVFKIAQKAEAAVAVIALDGTEKIHQNFPLHHTDVCLRVLEVIPPEEVAHCRTAVLGDRVRELLEENLEK